MINPTLRLILAMILFVLYVVDNAISFNVMTKIKGEIKKHKVDNTELIKKKVVAWLEENTVLYRHIKNAYPKFRIINYKKKNVNKIQ